MAWEQAEAHVGDFKDCLLHYLSCNLGMPILHEVRNGVTDEGIEEMYRGVGAVKDTDTEAINYPEIPDSSTKEKE